jgi:hypothetical protein
MAKQDRQNERNCEARFGILKSDRPPDSFLSMTVCNLTESSVMLSGDTLKGDGRTEAKVSEFDVTGSSSINIVQVSSANVVVVVVVVFTNTSINATSAFTISISAVCLVLSDALFFSSFGRSSADLDCSMGSDVAFQAVFGGSLLAV